MHDLTTANVTQLVELGVLLYVLMIALILVIPKQYKGNLPWWLWIGIGIMLGGLVLEIVWFVAYGMMGGL